MSALVAHRRRRRRSALVALFVAAAGCGSSPPVAVVGTTTASVPTTVTTPATTVVTTAPVTTRVPTTTSTSSAPGTTGDFEPACHAVASGSAASPVADPAFDRFGPLGAHPAVVVDLPTVPALSPSGGPSSQRTAPAVHAARVVGGVLVSLAAGSSSDLGQGMLAVVNLDGTTRWVRCFAAPGGQRVWTPPPTDGADTALVSLADRLPRKDLSATYLVVSLRTGETIGTSAADGPHRPELAALADHWVLAERPGEVLFGHGPECCGVSHLDSIIRYDLATDTTSEIAPPRESSGDTFATIDYTAAGDPVVVDGLTVRAVFHGGSWQTEAATLAAVLPARVDFAYSDAPPVLGAVDGAGRRLWSDGQFTGPGLEGTGVWTDGDVSIAQVCTEPHADNGCAALALVAVSTATGAPLWTLPGLRQVVAVADGYVLATDGPMYEPGGTSEPPTPGWELLDARTGERVSADQHWTDPTTFRAECCGGGEWVWAAQAGAIVVNVVDTELRLWLPRERTPSTPVRTSLP